MIINKNVGIYVSNIRNISLSNKHYIGLRVKSKKCPVIFIMIGKNWNFYAKPVFDKIDLV